ncbi:MAG TPA: MerR family transcriptional regulator [Nocardioidaceae bacterium]|nr:MerR family transcriptional regulator [Segeticoccus rhizosphaerae]HET7386212.1 MerR family transcriptional regulator [Nocardioidaceae bacterium]
MSPVEPDKGVYGISVAAELTGMDPQRLRLYESRGLLEPDRTAGGTRRYSAEDLDRLRRIGALLGDGLNLAGIAMVLDLQDQNTRLHHRLDDPTDHDGHHDDHHDTDADTACPAPTE